MKLSISDTMSFFIILELHFFVWSAGDQVAVKEPKGWDYLVKNNNKTRVSENLTFFFSFDILNGNSYWLVQNKMSNDCYKIFNEGKKSY